MKTNIFLSKFALRSLVFVRKFIIPSMANEAGVSPGWTLADIKTTGLLNLSGRFFYGKSY